MAIHINDFKLRRLPVTDYNTQIQRFSNQISNQVIRDLERDRNALIQIINELIEQSSIPPQQPSPPLTGHERTIITETSQDVTMTPVIPLTFDALVVNSPSISFENVHFEIVGFSSVIVRASCDIRIGVQYEDATIQTRREERIVPFSTVITIPGNYPPNATAEGNFILNNLEMSEDFDPSSGMISSMTTMISVSAQIRIVVPA